MSMGFTVESIAEMLPVTLAISAGKGQRQNLSWSSIDTSEVSHYEVIRNGATIATPTNTAYEDRSVSKGNIYSYVVVAVNAAGLRSEDSNTATVDLSKKRRRK
jgi:fibronectin type 3 domain-containing protein